MLHVFTCHVFLSSVVHTHTHTHQTTTMGHQSLFPQGVRDRVQPLRSSSSSNCRCHVNTVARAACLPWRRRPLVPSVISNCRAECSCQLKPTNTNKPFCQQGHAVQHMSVCQSKVSAWWKEDTLPESTSKNISPFTSSICCLLTSCTKTLWVTLPYPPSNSWHLLIIGPSSCIALCIWTAGIHLEVHRPFWNEKMVLVFEIKHKQRVGSHQFAQTIISPENKLPRHRSNLPRCPLFQARASISQSSKPFWNLSARLKVVLPGTLDRSILVNPCSLYEVGLEQPLYMSSLRNCWIKQEKWKNPLNDAEMPNLEAQVGPTKPATIAGSKSVHRFSSSKITCRHHPQQ